VGTLALALLGGGYGLYAGSITPDPADCFFTTISAEATVGPTFTRKLTAMSGDGRTALLRTGSEYSDPLNGFREALVTDEFLIHDQVRIPLTHHVEHNPRIPTERSSTWNSVDLPYDGSFAVTTKSPGGGVLLSLSDLSETPTPFSVALKVSADGTWIVGQTTDQKLLRWNRLNGRSELVSEPKARDVSPLSVIAISANGQVIVGQKSVDDPIAGGIVQATLLWKAGEGETILSLPTGFTASAMDDSGRVLAGSQIGAGTLVPMLWSQADGPVVLSLKVDGIVADWGQAKHISGDGQLVFGTVTVAGDERPVVWQRNGTAHALVSLIRGVDLGGFTLKEPTVMSRDGHTIGGFCSNQVNPVRAYLAGIALPGEGPRVSLARTANGNQQLTFRAKTGFRYQIQSATHLGEWSATEAEFVGTNLIHTNVLSDVSTSDAFYRVLVKP
jgi:hypothetical protein